MSRHMVCEDHGLAKTDYENSGLSIWYARIVVCQDILSVGIDGL